MKNMENDRIWLRLNENIKNKDVYSYIIEITGGETSGVVLRFFA
jgi:hypothetical protein